MAIYHMNCKNVSRGSGKCAVASSAYISREKLKDERQNMMFDYSKKSDIVYKDILAPDISPQWVHNRESLWNEVEKSETRCNSRLAKTIEFALPVELSKEQNIKLIQDFVKENFTSKGIITDIAYHDKADGNPHCHLMITTREISLDGFTKKNRELDKKDSLELWRESLSKIINTGLERNNVSDRVDHRSFKDRGIDKVPSIHEGFASRKMEARGKLSDRCEHNRQVVKYNFQIESLNKTIEAFKKEINTIQKNKELEQPVKKPVEERKHRIEKLKIEIDKLEKESAKINTNALSLDMNYVLPNLKCRIEELVGYPRYRQDEVKEKLGKLKEELRAFYEKYLGKEVIKEFEDNKKTDCLKLSEDIKKLSETFKELKLKKIGILDFSGKKKHEKILDAHEIEIYQLKKELQKVEDRELNIDFDKILAEWNSKSKEFNKKNKGDDNLLVIEDKKRYELDNNAGIYEEMFPEVKITDDTTKFDYNEQDYRNNVFSNMIYSYKSINNKVMYDSEEIIGDNISDDLFKVYPVATKDNWGYRFLISNNKLSIPVPAYFKENIFTRTLLQDAITLDVYPLDKTDTSTVFAKNTFTYDTAVIDSDFGKMLTNSTSGGILLSQNENDYVVAKDNNENLFIKTRKPVYIIPKLKTKINLVEKVAIKDKFSIGAEVDFTDILYKDVDSRTLNIPVASLPRYRKAEKNILFNGKIYPDSTGITYEYNNYLQPFTVSEIKRMDTNGNMLSQGNKYKLFDEENSTFYNSTFIDSEENDLKNIMPVVYMDKIVLTRTLKNDVKENLLTVYCNKSGNDIVGQMKDNEIYLMENISISKTDIEIFKLVNSIPGMKGSFDSVDVQRLERDGKEYITGFNIKGILMTTDLYGKSIAVSANSKSMWNDNMEALKNKDYQINSTNEKSADIIVRLVN